MRLYADFSVDELPGQAALHSLTLNTPQSSVRSNLSVKTFFQVPANRPAPMQEHHSPPTTASIALASALIAGVTGYFIGQARSIGFFGGSITAPKQNGKKSSSSDEESSDEEEVEEDSSQDPSPWAGNTEERKMVLVVRTDLGMTKGTLFLHMLERISSRQKSNSCSSSRQNRRPMRPCNPRLLQIAPPPQPQLPRPPPLGTLRADESCTTG